MGLFTKKQPRPTTTAETAASPTGKVNRAAAFGPANTESNGDFDIRESLYRQNRQLVITNKTLSLLRQLYQISLTSLQPDILGRDLVDTIRTVLEYDFTGIFMYEAEQDSLLLLTSSQSQRLADIYAKSGGDTKAIIRVSAASRDSFFGPIIMKSTLQYKNSILHFNPAVMPERITRDLEANSHIKATIGHPLSVGNKVVGILVISLNRPYEELFDFEKDSLATFADVIAIALDRSRLYADLETANSRQENLLHFISHEIKGYLAKNQAAFSGIAEGDYGAITIDTKELVDQALGETRKGVDTVMQILDASNLKKGTTKYVFAPFNLKDLVTQLVTDLTPSAQQKGLVLKTDIQGKTFTINGDKEQMSKHVIRNLIENSINYTPQGSISVSLIQKEKSLLFSVKDTGIGISDEDKKLLFTEGGHGKESRMINVMSTGYGLYIAKTIVTAHKGKIWAESEGKGKGSQFYMELPLS